LDFVRHYIDGTQRGIVTGDRDWFTQRFEEKRPSTGAGKGIASSSIARAAFDAGEFAYSV
jgi:hypothetical protein